MRKKLRGILSALLVVGILLPYSTSVKAEEINVNDGVTSYKELASTTKPDLVNKSSDTLWVEGNNSTNSNLELVKWRNKSSEGKYYLYLPSNVDINNLKIWHSFSTNPVVNGVTLKNGEYTSVFSNKGSYTVKVGGSSYQLKVMQSDNIPALFIQTSSGSMSKVHADKNYKDESGNLLMVTKDGMTTKADIDTIKGRGNSSWEAGERLFGKYPYSLDLDKKTNLLDMGKSKKWVLLANCFDQSLMRNIIVYNYAKEIGLKYTPEIQNVDLYCNGSYYGNYQLCEKVEIDSNRVDIADLEKETENCNLDKNGKPIKLSKYSRGGSTSGTSSGSYKYVNVPNNPSDITGGYLLEFELPERYTSEKAGFVTNRGQCVVINSPENASKAQVEYIRKYVQEMEDAVYSSNGYNSKGKHYTEYLDLETAAKMYLVQEGFMNNDGNATSFYLSKDRGEKLELSPVWDFDWAIGGYNTSKLTNPSGWFIKDKKIYGGSDKCLLAKLCTHDDFNKEVSMLWCTSMSDALKAVTGQKSSNNYKYLKTIDNCYNELHASANMNFKRYSMLGDVSWGSANTGSTFTENYQYVKNFMRKRVEFFDNKFKYESKDLTITTINTSKASPVSIGKSIDISATVKGGQGGYTYKYYINDELVSEESSNYTWTPKEIGEYRIKVVVTDKASNIVTKETTFSIKEVSNNMVKVYYKNTSYNKANIYYKIGTGAWTSLPGITMEKSSVYDGYFEATIDLGDEEVLTACFNNGDGTWDNNNKQNYKFTKGTYKIENGNVSKLP